MIGTLVNKSKLPSEVHLPMIEASNQSYSSERGFDPRQSANPNLDAMLFGIFNREFSMDCLGQRSEKRSGLWIA